jgi:hypothetical protein
MPLERTLGFMRVSGRSCKTRVKPTIDFKDSGLAKPAARAALSSNYFRWAHAVPSHGDNPPS